MAIKVGGTEVISDSRALSNIASVDAATVTALSDAGVGGGGALDFIASGAISAGAAVGLNDDGTVSTFAYSPLATFSTTPSVAGFNLVSGDTFTTTQDAYAVVDDKVLVVFSNASDSYRPYIQAFKFGDGSLVSTGYAKISNDIISSNSQDIVLAAAPDGRIVVGYYVQSATRMRWAAVNLVGDSLVVVRSGDTAISAQVGTGTSNALYMPDDDRFLLTMVGKAVMVEFDGTNYSYGTQFGFGSAPSSAALAYDSVNNMAVVVYRDNSFSGYGRVSSILVDPSTNTGSVGLNVTFQSQAAGNSLGLAFDTTSGKFIATTQNGYNTLTFSSPTSVSVGPQNSIYIQAPTSVYVPVIGKVLTAFRNSQQTAVHELSITGTSVVIDSTTNISVSPSQNYGNPIFDISTYGTALTAGQQRPSKLVYAESNEFIGVASENIADTESGSVSIVGGLNESQSGLTVGEDVQILSDQTIGQGGLPSRKIGVATSATSILLTEGNPTV